MAVTITAPQSGYFDRTGAITVSWTNSITSPPQTAYEIMYKLKTASSWSTLGRVTSTATSANLKPIYDAVSQDAVEFYYKVVVYHDLATLSSGNKEGGVEHSAVYSIMFHGSQIATLKVQETASSTQTYPLFNGSTTPTAKLNVRTTSSATGTAPLVASGHPLAGRGKVVTASGYTAFIGGSSPTFAASGQVQYGYFYGYRYQYSFSYYNRANYTYGSYNVFSYNRTNYSYDRFNNTYHYSQPATYGRAYYRQYYAPYGSPLGWGIFWYAAYLSKITVSSGPNYYRVAARTYDTYTSQSVYAYRYVYAYDRTVYAQYYFLSYYQRLLYTTTNYSYYNRPNYSRVYYAYREPGRYTYGSYRTLNTFHPVAYYRNVTISYRTSYTYYYRVYLYSTYYRYTYYWYTAYYNVPGGGRAGRTFYRYAYGRRDFYGNSSAQTGYTTRYYINRQPFYSTYYTYTTHYYGYWPNSYSFYNNISSYTRIAYVSSYTGFYGLAYYYRLGYYAARPAYARAYSYVSYTYLYRNGIASYYPYSAYATLTKAYYYFRAPTQALNYTNYTVYNTTWTSPALVSLWVLGSQAGGYGVQWYYSEAGNSASYYKASALRYSNNIAYNYAATYYNVYYRNYYRYVSSYTPIYTIYNYAYVYSYTPTYHYTNNLSYNYQYYTR